MQLTTGNWKTIDILGQVAMIVLPFTCSFLFGYQSGSSVFIMLFTLGAWLLVSFIVHFTFKSNWKSPLRIIYTILLALLAILGISALVNQDLLGILLYSALFGGPVLGLLYFVITFFELMNIKRPLKQSVR